MAQDTRQTPSVRTQPVPTFQPRRPIADISLLKNAVSEFIRVTDEYNFEFLVKTELRRQVQSSYWTTIMSICNLQSKLELIPVENKGVNPPLENGPCDKQGPSLQAPSAPTVVRKADNFSGQSETATEELQTIPAVRLTRSSMRMKPTCASNDSNEAKEAANTLLQLKINCATGPECRIHTAGINVNPLHYAIGSASLGPNKAEQTAIGIIGNKLRLDPRTVMLESVSPYNGMSEREAKLHRLKRAIDNELDSNPPPTKVVIRDGIRMDNVRKWVKATGFESLPYPQAIGDPVYLPRLGPMKTYQVTRGLFLDMLASGLVKVTSKNQWRKAMQSYPPISSTLHEQLLDDKELVFKLGNLAYVVTKSDAGHVQMAPSAINIFFDDRF
jgi:hypothetical protein